MKPSLNLTTVKRAYKLFAHASADKHIIRHNVRAWLRSLELLGNKHILATPVQRKH
jgi:hypothetical protein